MWRIKSKGFVHKSSWVLMFFCSFLMTAGELYLHQLYSWTEVFLRQLSISFLKMTVAQVVQRVVRWPKGLTVQTPRRPYVLGQDNEPWTAPNGARQHLAWQQSTLVCQCMCEWANVRPRKALWGTVMVREKCTLFTIYIQFWFKT